MDCPQSELCWKGDKQVRAPTQEAKSWSGIRIVQGVQTVAGFHKHPNISGPPPSLNKKHGLMLYLASLHQVHQRGSPNSRTSPRARRMVRWCSMRCKAAAPAVVVSVREIPELSTGLVPAWKTVTPGTIASKGQAKNGAFWATS